MASRAPFTILGETPNGAPGPDTVPPLRAPISPDKVHDVIRLARDVILTATGPRDGMISTIDHRAFDQAIRAFMPVGHYAAAPNQPVSAMDYKMYACRLVHRLLNAIAGRRLVLGGAYNSHLATNARANALYEAVLEIAADNELRDFTQSNWDARLDAARLRRRAVAEERRASREEDQGQPTAEDLERRVRDEVERRVQAKISERFRVEAARIESERSPQQATTRPEPVFLWAESLTDGGARKVFLHLANYGSVSEAEAIGFLGSPRAFRRFSAEFEEHSRLVPFNVRIEAGMDGKRYVKEEEK